MNDNINSGLGFITSKVNHHVFGELGVTCICCRSWSFFFPRNDPSFLELIFVSKNHMLNVLLELLILLFLNKENPSMLALLISLWLSSNLFG